MVLNFDFVVDVCNIIPYGKNKVVKIFEKFLSEELDITYKYNYFKFISPNKLYNYSSNPVNKKTTLINYYEFIKLEKLPDGYQVEDFRNPKEGELILNNNCDLELCDKNLLTKRFILRRIKDTKIQIDLSDFCYKLSSEYESKELQEILFKNNCKWFQVPYQKVKHTKAEYIFVDNCCNGNLITYGSYHHTKKKVLTLHQLKIKLNLDELEDDNSKMSNEHKIFTCADGKKYKKTSNFRTPKKGEYYVYNNIVFKATSDYQSMKYLIVEPLEKIKEAPQDKHLVCDLLKNTTNTTTIKTKTEMKLETELKINPIKAVKNWLSLPARNFVKVTNWTLQHLVFLGLIAGLPIGAYYAAPKIKCGYEIVKSIRIVMPSDKTDVISSDR